MKFSPRVMKSSNGVNRVGGDREGDKISNACNIWRVMVCIVTTLVLTVLLSLHPAAVTTSGYPALSSSQQAFSRFLSSALTSSSVHSPPKATTISRTAAHAKPSPKQTERIHSALSAPPSRPMTPQIANATQNSSRMLPFNKTDIFQFPLSKDTQLMSHMKKAGFHVVMRAPDKAFTSFKIHSARSGSADRLDGIGAKCDW